MTDVAPKPPVEAPTGPEPVAPMPWLEEMPPRQIVAELDRYIVGQDAAKKARPVLLEPMVRLLIEAPAKSVSASSPIARAENEATSSVATLPLAPGACGQPPIPPKQASKRRIPTSQAA